MTGNETKAAGDTRNGLLSLTPAILYTSLLMLMGACGNALVCYVYGFRWQRTVTKIFIFSLAALDLMNSLICMPTEIAILVKIVSFDAPDWCRITRFLTYTLNGSSSLILMAIAVDRYYKIHRPLKCFFTDRRAKLVCFGAVLFATALSWPSLIMYGNLTIPIAGSDDVGVMCLVSDEYIDTWWPLAFYSVYFACYMALVVAITVLYSLIAKRLVDLRKKQKERLKLGHSGLRSSAITELPPGETVPLSRIVIGDEKELQQDDVTNRHDDTQAGEIMGDTASSEEKSFRNILNQTVARNIAELNRLQDDCRRRSVTFKLPQPSAAPGTLQTSPDGGQTPIDGPSNVGHEDEQDPDTQDLNTENCPARDEPDTTLGDSDPAQEHKPQCAGNKDFAVKGGPYQMTLLRIVCAPQPELRDERKLLDPPRKYEQHGDEDAASADVVSGKKRRIFASLRHGQRGVGSTRRNPRGEVKGDKDSGSEHAGEPDKPFPSPSGIPDDKLNTDANQTNSPSLSLLLAIPGDRLHSNGSQLGISSLLSVERGAAMVDEDGMSSRNSFLMPPGGYPGGHTPSSRLPTPTDTPNPAAADNRPVKLSSALLFDRLSKKMAYRPAKTTRMLFAISIVFVVSFLPFFVVVLIRAVQGKAFLASLSNIEIVVVSIFIRSSFISNAANPIIYGVCNKQFRVECRQLIGRFSGRRSDVTVRVIEQTDDALACGNSN